MTSVSPFQFHQSVSSVLSPSVGVTLWLVVYAFLLILLVGIGAGLLPSFIRRSNIVVTILASVGIAIPTFVAAMILIQVFALKLGWFPTSGSGSGSFWPARLAPDPPGHRSGAVLVGVRRADLPGEHAGAGGLEHVETARESRAASVMVFRNTSSATRPCRS